MCYLFLGINILLTIEKSIQTKTEFWDHVYAQLEALLDGQRNWVIFSGSKRFSCAYIVSGSKSSKRLVSDLQLTAWVS